MSGELKLSERLEAAASIRENGRETCALLREAAEQARRVEGAATGEVWQHACIGGQRTSTVVVTREASDGLTPMGQRIALVPLNGGGS